MGSCGLLLLLLLGAAGPLLQAEPAEPVSAERSLAWGPGLEAGIAVPVRYFYIQAVSAAGRNFSRSPPGIKQFKVVIKALSPKEVTRIYTPRPLDRNDGTFLMRYRMYGSVTKGLKIEIFYGDQHVAQSPYILKEPVYHEYCDCPEEDPEVWQDMMSCPSQEPQITEDFISFPTIDLQRMLKEIPAKFSQARGAIVHYTIRDNHIYRRSLGKYTDFKMFSDEMFVFLTWSFISMLETGQLSIGKLMIHLGLYLSSPGVALWIPEISSCRRPFWENKTEKALFRGRDSREERLHLVKLSKENPELLDAGITGYFFFREKEKELGKAQLMGFFDFFKYKYQVNIDGTVAAYRFPYLLLGDSLVLKQDSQYYEHFYIGLKPWKHYVPVKRNLEDLLEKIKWAKENDEEARKIAKEGQLTARELLQPHRFYCYYYKVLQKYAERQASKPEIRDGMELVPQPDDRDSVCSCHRKKPLREDL
ncbi:hypothetical protein DV515_00003319 [Chloebia gouldiae]|uniref:Glycosyl transferase CAP10 domain-containing protein n=1 Tax=Chloebia gouldiae TaxID=44316 RepID=A0A3L8SU89_CHLGU|nr:hypothetical protein DV515_00003319 [Chloebia gouldiae]